jgi:hypothetical protein
MVAEFDVDFFQLPDGAVALVVRGRIGRLTAPSRS